MLDVYELNSRSQIDGGVGDGVMMDGVTEGSGVDS